LAASEIWIYREGRDKGDLYTLAGASFGTVGFNRLSFYFHLGDRRPGDVSHPFPMWNAAPFAELAGKLLFKVFDRGRG
jgi:hypothetical protein